MSCEELVSSVVILSLQNSKNRNTCIRRLFIDNHEEREEEEEEDDL